MTEKEALCGKVVALVRAELCDRLPHLEEAFAALRWQACTAPGFRVDGRVIHYAPEELLGLYAREPGTLKRGYLHMLLHCLYLHRFSPRSDPWWHLACDLTVERVLDGLDLPHFAPTSPEQRQALADIPKDLLTAEQVYGYLSSHDVSFSPALFSFDDHSQWAMTEANSSREKWGRLLLAASGGRAGKGKRDTTPGSTREAIHRGSPSEFDYRGYLSRFTFLREEMQLDLEIFDYAYYQLGMEQYHGMPFLEPLEYQEVRRLEELVIAMDTSGSCSKETLSRFLAETYQILAAQENFFQKMKVYFIQCDCVIQDVACIRSRKEWMDYARRIEIHGRGGTDFTPVFNYVAALREQKELRQLKALLYFTDGDGVYPSAPPDYEAAFVLLRDSGHQELVPKWGKCLLI